MSYHELTITVSEPFRNALIERLSSAGCLGVIERDEAFVAYFPGSIDLRTITGELLIFQALLEKSGREARLAFSQTMLPDQDWNQSWKKGFVPIDVGNNFTVLPPWEETKNGRINLVIDPAMAFGTGHHETTRSCLVLMERHAARNRKERMLDVGTGTGILAIAAAKLEYRHVVAVDTDPLAVEAARTNSALNRATGIDIREGSLSQTSGTYDLITANIVSGVLVMLAPALALHLDPGGIAALSGILADQEEEVTRAMATAGLHLIERYPDGKWVSLVVTR